MIHYIRASAKVLVGGALLNNVGDISIAYLFLGLRTCLGLENFALVRELCPGSRTLSWALNFGR